MHLVSSAQRTPGDANMALPGSHVCATVTLNCSSALGAFQSLLHVLTDQNKLLSLAPSATLFYALLSQGMYTCVF